ncbi:MAG: hypothetical protein PUF17_07345 [Lactimicrobium massiliense]|nr:hypothetical protein [Lactimicrobium massiliense]MDD6560770.1 hypothetical protein [Lactimicrobium massiliense]
MNDIYKPYKVLAAAIIAQACNDYLADYRHWLKAKDGSEAKTLAEYALTRDKSFFYTDYFKGLTERDIEPDILVNRLEYLAKYTSKTIPIYHS